VVVIIGVLGILLLLLLVQPFPTEKALRSNCYNNLRQIGVSFRLFAVDNREVFPPGVSTNQGGSREYGAAAYAHWVPARNELGTPSVLICPTDDRLAATNFFRVRDTNVSYFVNLDAATSRPDMILSGERNLTLNGAKTMPGLVSLTDGQTLSWDRRLHRTRGHLLYVNGSVAWVTNLLINSPDSGVVHLTNRLAVP
jgi:hypothetical protein